MSTAARLAAQIARDTERLAAIRAHELRREIEARQRAREAFRRAQLERDREIGAVVRQAGMDTWRPEELLGLLLHTMANAGDSVTMRMGYLKIGQEAWPNRTPKVAASPPVMEEPGI